MPLGVLWGGVSSNGLLATIVSPYPVKGGGRRSCNYVNKT